VLNEVLTLGASADKADLDGGEPVVPARDNQHPDRFDGPPEGGPQAQAVLLADRGAHQRLALAPRFGQGRGGLLAGLRQQLDHLRLAGLLLPQTGVLGRTFAVGVQVRNDGVNAALQMH
jgi:hypothetical protein